MNDRSTSDSRHAPGPVAAFVPPAAGWRRKRHGLTTSRLFAPLAGLIGMLVLLGVSGALMLRFPAHATGLYAVQLGLVGGAGCLVALILFRIQRQLMEPLGQLRNWAQRMRAGNLSARIPAPASGEFALLARDINDLGESLKTLSREMDEQVRKQTERIAQKTRSLEILYDVAASISLSRDLDDLLTRFLHTLTEVVDARAATVRLLSDDDQMRLVASTGLSEDVVEKEKVVPVNRCLCGQAVSGGEILCQEDIRQCGQMVGVPLFEHSEYEMIAVPLQYRGRTLGVYNLFVARQGLVAREDVKELLTSIGRHLGMAIEKARLDNEAKRLSIMQERTMLAHELHDSLAQTLASLRFQVQTLDENLQPSSGDHRVHRDIERIKNSLDEAYTELRELLAHFRGPFDGRGLLPAIETIVQRFRKETGIATFLQKEWDHAELPANLEMQVVRIVQEALANIRKHSQAHAVRVMLRADGNGSYRVLIEDDGVGFSEPTMTAHPGEHVGLSIMTERARRIGGVLRFESEPSEGTRVLLTFRHPNTETNKTIPLAPAL
jgi:two-component system, NarL family, nitrate/nitrite sensor histidine kinase NarX